MAVSIDLVFLGVFYGFDDFIVVLCFIRSLVVLDSSMIIENIIGNRNGRKYWSL